MPEPINPGFTAFGPSLPDRLPGSDTEAVDPQTAVDRARRETPAPSIGTIGAIDPLGVGFSIFVPRGILNRDTPPAPDQVPPNLSGVGQPLAYLFGMPTTVALPHKRGSDNAYYTILYNVGLGPIESFETVTVAGVEVDTTGETPGTPFLFDLNGGLAQMQLYTGDGVQNVSTWASTHISGYTSAHPNYAMIGIRIPKYGDSREPRVLAKVKGLNNIIDYRVSPTSTGWTDNPALCLAHFLEQFEGHSVNQQSIIDAADYMDSDPGDGSKRRTINIALTQRLEAKAHRDVLRAHAACGVVFTGNEFYLVPNQPASAVMDIGPDQILGSIDIDDGSEADVPDDVIVEWVDENGVRQTARATDANGAQPSVRKYYGINNAAQAKRQAIEDFKHLRDERDKYRFTMRATGSRLRPGHIVNLTDPEVGLQDKPARLLVYTVPKPGFVGWVAEEYQPGVFSNELNGDPLIADTPLENPALPPAVTGLTLTARNQISPTGGVDNQIVVSWNALTTFGFILQFLVEVYDSNVSPATLVQEYTVAPNKTQTVVSGLEGGTEYEIKVAVQSTVGAIGVFANGFETALGATLVARWPFDSPSYLVDVVGELDLTEASGTVTEIVGKIDEGRTQSAANSTLETAAGAASDVLNSGAFTVLGWYMMDAVGAGTQKGKFLNKYGTVNLPTPTTFELWRLVCESSPLNLELIYVDTNDAELTWSVGPTMTLDTWHFISLSYESGLFEVVFDGDVYLREDFMYNTLSADGQLRFGPSDSGTGARTAWDDVRYYNGRLSLAEIQAIYAAESGP